MVEARVRKKPHGPKTSINLIGNLYLQRLTVIVILGVLFLHVFFCEK